MKVSGHSLEELDDLREQFEELAAHCVEKVTAELSLALTASINLNDVNQVQSRWDEQVNNELMPQVVGVYEGGALTVAHQVLNHPSVPIDAGIPSVTNDYALGYLKQAQNRLSSVGNELWQNVQSELIAGMQAGESIDELAVRISKAGQLTVPRAKTVARTEVNGASNAGSDAQLAAAGLVGTKEWLATGDTRTREDHVVADGQKVPTSGVFSVGGWSLRYPGDPDGPASEIVNCRCTQLYDIDDDATANLCECGITAAGANLYGVNAAPSSCVCPASTSTVDHTLVNSLSVSQQKYVYDLFQYPKPISPAYGGAKIHKTLATVREKLGESDALKKLSNHDILSIVDNHYAKSSFTSKYDEWLASSAGKKAVPSAAKVMTQDIKSVAQVLDVKPVTPIVDPVETPIPKTTVGHVPLGQQPGTIDHISQYDQADFYQDFKKNKVTSIWSGNKIWESLQATKAKGYYFSDHEALKILDKFATAEGKKAGYLEKMLQWENSPAGKKVLGEAVTPVKTAEKVQKIETATEKVTEEVTTSTLSYDTSVFATPVKDVPLKVTGGVEVQTVDLDTVAQFTKNQVLAKWSNFGPLLTKPDKTIYTKLHELKTWMKSQGHDFSDLDLLRIIDDVKAKQLGVTNGHLYEKKMVSYLSKPAGKSYAKALAEGKTTGTATKTATKVASKVTKTVTENSFGKVGSTQLNADVKTLVSDIRAKMTTGEGQTFTDISPRDAQTMMNSMLAKQPWKPSERAALRYYTGHNYVGMNGALRKTADVTETMAKKVREAQAGMRPSERAMVVHRGADVRQFNVSSVDQSLVGKTFQDNGFMSTSVGSNPAFSGTVRLDIEVPEGTPVAFVQSISHYASENEMLLAAGTRYKVLSVKVSGHKTVVRVRVIR